MSNHSEGEGGPAADTSAGVPALLICTAAGLAGGLLEGLLVVKQRFHDGRIVWRTPDDVVWAAPLACAALGLAVGLVLALVRRFTPLRSAAVPVVCATLLALLPPLLRIASLSWWASALLALGVGVQVARLLGRRPRLLRRVTVAAAALGVVATAAAAWALHAHRAGALREIEARLPAPAANAPNVVLIVLDTVRATDMSLHGYARPTSPRLDALAAEGVVFEHAISTTSWTLPAHVSLFTGVHRHQTRAHWKGPMEPGLPTLSEWFDGHGYRTVGFAGNVLYGDRAFGLARGFAEWEDFVMDPRRVLLSSALVGRFVAWWDALTGADDGVGRKGADGIFARATEWIDTHRDRPFFLFVNLFDAHGPYEPPPGWKDRFRGADEQDVERAAYDALETGRAEDYTPAQIALARRLYDEAIAYTDDEVGRFVDALRERGLLDDTVLVVTSDHGEAFGEHGSLHHGQDLYDETTHVPLVLRYPRAAPAGRRVAEVVTLRDVAATIQALAAPGETPTLPGVPLSRTWTGGAAAGSPVIARMNHSPHLSDASPASKGPAHAVFLEGHVVLLDGTGGAEVYAYPEDWEQRHDLAATPAAADLIARARATLIEVGAARRGD